MNIEESKPIKVVVTGIDVSTFDLAVLLVKLAIAGIPAAFVLMMIVAVFIALGVLGR